ncbi:hypothetical protein K435DRAFT_842063 [Dendrothele bispora CBS 962.96]|uniref:DUF6533 domain-containing protein n=1 Tax=Dendrothele bispora (strain CBS 962.96) TaxID=1314807 RepID=A0A4S8LI71_DENBC|nr:hypothetical protein K435DRAFT_842063 [Dendrothele bispora CBS 962.96]
MSTITAQDAYSINDQVIANYLHLAGLVLLAWDHLLTFSMEVEYCWKGVGSFITSLFLFNRYFPLLGTVIITIPIFPSSLPASSCEPFHIFREIVLVVTEIVVSILLTIRIYAIYDRQKKILFYMASFGAILAGLALFALFTKFGPPTKSAISLTSLGCHTNLLLISHAAQEAAAWEALFVYDVLLFTMVLLKGYKTKGSLERVPILDLVLRHGAIYFAVMALANLANIFTFYFAGPSTRGSLSTFSSAISVTMISRLTFNLHSSAKIDQYWSTDQSSTVLTTLAEPYLSTCHFASPPTCQEELCREEDEERQAGFEMHGLSSSSRTRNEG